MSRRVAHAAHAGVYSGCASLVGVVICLGNQLRHWFRAEFFGMNDQESVVRTDCPLQLANSDRGEWDLLLLLLSSLHFNLASLHARLQHHTAPETCGSSGGRAAAQWCPGRSASCPQEACAPAPVGRPDSRGVGQESGQMQYTRVKCAWCVCRRTAPPALQCTAPRHASPSPCHAAPQGKGPCAAERVAAG